MTETNTLKAGTNIFQISLNAYKKCVIKHVIKYTMCQQNSNIIVFFMQGN